MTTLAEALRGLLRYAEPIPDNFTNSSFVTLTCTVRSIRNAREALSSLPPEPAGEIEGLAKKIKERLELFDTLQVDDRANSWVYDAHDANLDRIIVRALSERAHSGREGAIDECTKIVQDVVDYWKCPPGEDPSDRAWNAVHSLLQLPATLQALKSLNPTSKDNEGDGG